MIIYDNNCAHVKNKTQSIYLSFTFVLCNVHAPHYLYSPLEVETLLDDLSEPHLSHVFGRSEIDFENIPDIVCVLNTRQLRDTRRSHLGGHAVCYSSLNFQTYTCVQLHMHSHAVMHSV